VADKRCDNGHFIDELWDLCPYCPQDESDPATPAQPSRVTAEAPRPVAVPALAPTHAPVATSAGSFTGGLAMATTGPSLAVRREPPPPPPPVAAPLSSPAVERTVASRIEPGTQQKRYVVGWLVGITGPTRGESFPVRMGRNVIGRDRRSDIVINDDQASSHHADLVFRPEEKRFILMDHNSTNGTYVNEAEIEPRRDLLGKDVVRIGSHKFLFMPLCHDGFFLDDDGLLR
jgi:hypothetical protein